MLTGRRTVRPVRKLAALVLLFLALPGVAEAKRHERMSFAFARTVAVDYWAKHHVTVPCKPTRRLLSWRESAKLDASFGTGVSMATYPGTCEVQITRTGATYRTDRDLEWLYCTDVVHEIGHIAGLTHDYGGIMTNPPTGQPWGCDHPHRFRRQASVTRDGWMPSQAWPRTAA